MIPARMSKWGLRDWHLHSGSLASIVLCLALWIRAKTVDQASRANAERRAIFVGLWPPMFWLLGDAVERAQGAAPMRSQAHRGAVSRVVRRAACGLRP